MMIGRTVSHYDVTEKLGGGGMGVVYRAEDRQLERPVALKFLPQETAHDEQAKLRFVQEAKSASKLDHPHIGAIHEIGETDTGRMFIVMPFYEGETLKEKVARGPLPIEKVRQYGRQIAGGLAAAHEAGIIHRDIKPANVMITAAERAKIVDFGLAKMAGVDLTDEGAQMGTPAYMSPEQIRGGSVGPHTDLWALGTVLFELLTGERPFPGSYPEAVRYAILHEDPRDLRSLRSEVPARLAELIHELLQKDPADRPEVAEQVAQRLAASSGDRPPHPESGGNAGGSAEEPAIETGRDRPFVAVLPLEPMGPESGTDAFAEGLHEEILVQLAKISALGVKSRTTMLQYRDAAGISQIGRELEVEAVMEGSVRRAAGRIRVSARLYAAGTGELCWSETFERTLSTDEIFGIQAAIARRISEALHTHVSESEATRIKQAPTADLPAYDAFLAGRHHYWQYHGRWEVRLLDQAIAKLRESVDRDETFAEAWAWLSRAYAARARRADLNAQSEWIERARSAVETAQEIGRNRTAIHLARAAIYRVTGTLTAEMEAYREALDLQPDNALAKAELSDNLARQGKLAEAVEVAREAVVLAPRDPWVLQEMGDQLRQVGLHELSEAWNRHLLDLEPAHLEAYVGLASTRLRQGRPGEALSIWEEFFEEADEPPDASFHFAAVAALAADQNQRALEYLDRLEDTRPETEGAETGEQTGRPSIERRWFGTASRAHRGLALLRLGNEEQGRALLQEVAQGLRSEIEESAVDRKDSEITLVGAMAHLGEEEEALNRFEQLPTEQVLRCHWHPLFDPIRGEGRFQKRMEAARREQAAAREEVLEEDLELRPPTSVTEGSQS